MGDPVTQACAQAVGSGVVPLSDAIKASYRTLKRQYDYVRKLERNFSLFEKAEQDLCDKDSDVRKLLELYALERETTNQVQTWLQNVLAQKGKITLVKKSYNERPKCSCAMCPFLPLRKLGKCVVRQTANITALLGKVPINENEMVIGRQAERVESTDSRKIVDLESLNENVKDLFRNLDDPGKKRIGIWGAWGIGKTTILKRLIKELEKKPDMFNMIIMVKVGKEWSISAIQKDIAGRLKLDVEGIDTENQVARAISKALAEKKYLLVLDDVFSELNLGDVGIHEHHQQGKLVMACQSRYVLHKMDLNNEITVKGLSEEDGRVLFKELVGPNIFDRPKIKVIAERMVKECGCNPQMIKGMAYYLKYEIKVDVWEETLKKLRSPTWHPLEDMEDTGNALGLFYDRLTEDGKTCLKYGAVFPEGYEMYQDYLIECWKAQNCLKEVETMKRAREKGYTVLKDLISYCLLEKGKTEEHVKMSLICWKMARRKYKENKLIVGEDEQHPTKEKWEQAQMISLICTNLKDSHLPESPECTNISTLLLQKNKELKNIPCEFFKQMPQLQVLDLYSTGIASLPSVSNLSNIKALYLNHCPLEGLPDEIQKLKNLEVLDIRGTGIRGFPTEVGAMSSLRCLRVSFACCMGSLNHVIGPSQPVTNHLQAGGLSSLEELVVDVDPNDPNCKELLKQIAKGVVDETILDKVAIEIASLTKLTSLCFYFPSLGCFEKFIEKPQSSGPVGRLVDNYRSFQIQVGHLTKRHNRHQLEIAGCSDRRQFLYSAGRYASGSPPTSITEVLKHACSFELIGHKDILSLSELGNDALESLEVCIIEECIGMKTILMGGGNQIEVPVLKYLEKLHLSGLHSLDCIWEGPIVQGSLAKLTTLTLSDCRNIEKILSWEMAKQLPQLEHLIVENCPRVVEVIEADPSAQTNPMGISQNPHNQSTHTTPASTPSQAPANQSPQRNQVGSKVWTKFFQCIGLPRSVTTNKVRMFSQAPPSQSTHTNQNGTLSNAPPSQSPQTNQVGILSLASPNRPTQATQVGSSSQAPHNPSPHANQASTSSQAGPNPSPHANHASTSSKSPVNQSTQINHVGILSKSPPNQSTQTTPAGTSSLAPANQLPPTNHASTSSQAPPKQSPQKNQATTLSQSPPNQLSQATPTGNLLQAHLNQSPQNNHIGTSSQAPCTFQLKMKLMTLQLISLPMLVSIYGDKTNQLITSSQAPPNQPSQTIQASTSSQAPLIDILEWTSLKKLQIRDCTKLQNLSLTTTNAPWLRSIECDEDWWRGLNFHDEELKSNLEACCLFQ